jgi:hypothetical protein
MAQRPQRLGDKPLALLGDTASDMVERQHHHLSSSVHRRIKKRAKSRGNNYFVMRHGEAEQNVKNIVFGGPTDNFALTETGVRKTSANQQNL